MWCLDDEMGMFSLIFYRKTVSSLYYILIFRGENDLKRDFIYKTFTKYLHELQWFPVKPL